MRVNRRRFTRNDRPAKAQVWEIRHHTVAEIQYDGAWHMLDPDCHLFFLGKDNRTIASIEEIEKDLAFYARTRAYRGEGVAESEDSILLARTREEPT